MEHYIKILPKYNISTFSKYAFDNLGVEKDYLDIKFITHNSEGKEFKNGGYVSLFYGENKQRYVVYENIPSFGHVLGRFETMEEAASFVENLESLNNVF